MSLVVTSDLDRTLIYSASALDLRGEDRHAPRLVCLEVYKGKPQSFVTQAALEGIAALTAAGVLVPVTTRTVEQYRRIQLPGPAPAFAICANGGRLLVDGVEDADYRTRLLDRVAQSSAPLEQVWDILGRHATVGIEPAPFVKSLRQADDLFCYAVAHERAPLSWVEDLAGQVADLGWGVSVQHRKTYLVPAALTKVHAAHEVMERSGGTRLLAAGDAHLDTELLAAADAGIRPAHGELHTEGWSAPNVAVTSAAGVAAGEEIVVWMLGRSG